MKVVLTGAAGFFASHLVPRLLAEGHEVVGIDLVHQSEAWRLGDAMKYPSFTYEWGSAGDYHHVEGAVVIHAAAVTDVRWATNYPRYTFQRNTEDCMNLLAECRRQGAAQLIVFSSHSVYGKQDLIPTPEDVAIHPSTWYGAAKAAQEMLALSYYHEHHLPVTVVRPTLMYGERERPGALVSTFLKRAYSGLQVTLDGGGRQTRNMNYVGNTVDAIMLMLGQEWALGGTFNISSNEEVSIRDLAERVAGLAQRDFGEFAVDGPARAGEEGRLFLGWEKLAKHGYQPRVDFEEGLRRTATWVSRSLTN